MLSSGVIMWCYHLGWEHPPFLFFLENSLTPLFWTCNVLLRIPASEMWVCGRTYMNNSGKSKRLKGSVSWKAFFHVYVSWRILHSPGKPSDRREKLAGKFYIELAVFVDRDLHRYSRYHWLTLIKLALLTHWCRMVNNMMCPCTVLSPADPKILSEDTNKMSKSQQLVDTIRVWFSSMGVNYC